MITVKRQALAVMFFLIIAVLSFSLSYAQDLLEGFDARYLSNDVKVSNLSGTYKFIGEGVWFDAEGDLFPIDGNVAYEQGTGTFNIEQHGSMFKMTDDEGMTYQGSTMGNAIMATYNGYVEFPGMGKMHFETHFNGWIEEGKKTKIFLNWVMHGYDGNQSLFTNTVGSVVLEKIE